MIRGLYSAASGMLSAQLGEGVVANNLANSDTAGFKAETAAFSSFAPLAVNRAQPAAFDLLGASGNRWTPIGSVSSGAIVDVTGINWSAGAVAPSQNPLAVALVGPGLFGVRTAAGLQYTRAGDFRLNRNGTLVDSSGNPVIGVNGAPIQVPGGAAASVVSVDTGGFVRAGNAVVGQIAVFRPAQAALLPSGQGAYALAAGTAAPTAATGTVRPGFLEQSNVNVVQQMAALLQLQQAFSSDQRAVQTADKTATVAIAQVGTVA
jgi:flagellar basal body rod protein FlgG